MRILVVEDDLNLNRLLCATLESEGYSVDNCFNGEDAVLYTDAERNQGYSSDTYNGGRTEGLSGRAIGGTDRVHRSDENSYRGFSSGDESIGKGTDREYQADHEGYRETGWANERELFERSLFGEGDYGTSYEEDVSDLYDPVRSPDSIGTDTLYLIGGIGNLIDEDAPVEDSTTMHQRKERKKYNGPVMGGM